MKTTKELVKKFYIEHGWISSSVDMSIVYGTISKQNFNVKERNDIIGRTFDSRISLDSSLLFDKFEDAVNKFMEVSKKLKGDLVNQMKEFEDNEKKLQTILKEVKK